MFKVARYNSSFKEQWDRFVEESNNGTFILYRGFIEYHKERFIDHSVVIFKGKKIVALLPANEKDNLIYSHQGLTYGGLIIHISSTSEDIIHCFQSLLKYYLERGFSKLIYKPIPQYYLAKLAFEIDQALYLSGSRLMGREMSSVIDMKRKPKWQNRRIRSATKAVISNLTFEIDSSSWEEFWQVLETNLQKRFNKKPVHKISEIKHLKRQFGKNIILCLAFEKENVLAGMVLFINKKTIHAQYIASNKRGKEIGALDGLMKTLISNFNEFDFFSLGISSFRESKKINKGLMEWKEGFGAKLFPHDYYEIETGNYVLLDSSKIFQ